MTAVYGDETLAKKMRQIQSLFDKADHPNTPPDEADSARAMAQKLMAKYQIAEEQARQQAVAQGTDAKPIRDEFFLCDNGNKFYNEYWWMLAAVAAHVGVRTKYDWKAVDLEDGRRVYGLIAHIVGFESDVRFAEMLYTNIRAHFSETLEPRLDRSLTDQQNVYRLRNAGMERNRIAALLWGAAMTDGAAHGRVTKLYSAECKARGEDPKVVGRSVNAKTYRSTFAEEYVSAIRERLSRMRAMAGIESGAIVLRGRKEAVTEAYYDFFPSERPKPRIEGENYSGCAKCKKAKSGRCRDHSYSAPKERPYSAVGAAAGRRAGESADLTAANPRGKVRVTNTPDATRQIG
jgi:Protein of unknown function (DUF2786)